MLKADLVKLQGYKFVNRLWIGWFGIARGIENFLKILQGDFRFTINIDDVSQFLQRGKNEERIDHEREKLPNCYLLPENQIQHQEQDAGTQGINSGSLNKTQTAQIFHFLKFERQNLCCDAIKAFHFLMRESQTLY